MTKEQECFLTILSDYMYGRSSHLPEGLDWEKLAQYAKQHQVEGIMWHQCQGFLKSNPDLEQIALRLKTASMAEVFYYSNNRRVMDELEKAFQARNMRYAVIKGLKVAELFPIPAYRTMGDMDIVVPAEDQQQADDILRQMGFVPGAGESVHSYHRGMIRLEIHHELVNAQNAEIDLRRVYFNRIWEHVHQEDGICELDWNFHFLFLIEHTKQHFSFSGVGFRQFMDIAMTAMNRRDLDWEWIRTELGKIDLWNFAVTAFAFCKRWWGTDAPCELPEIEEHFFAQSTEFVFQNGVFGFDNENARAHAVEKQMRVASSNKFFRLPLVVLKKICISYNTALTLPYCSFVRGRKYLLPLAWIYRVFYVAIRKKGNIHREAKLVFGSGDVIKTHRELMDRWGV